MASNAKGILGAAILGLAAGALAGVLFAPKSGKETRSDLMKLAEKMRDDIQHKISQLGKVTRAAYDEVVNTVVSQYEETKEITKEQAQKLKEDFGQSYDRIKTVAEGAVEEVEEQTRKATRKPA